MKKTIKNGFLISVEGVDGSGKSSFCSLLEKKLSSQFSVLLTKEPGGTFLGKSLRNLLLHTTEQWDSKSEFLLFAADRAQHFSELVLPALANNQIVISDRMGDSSLVYQGYVKKLPLELLQKINAWVMQNKMPDITFLLDVDEETVHTRMALRNIPDDVFEKNKAEILLRIEGFRALFAQKENGYVLNATHSCEDLVNEALDHLHSIFDERS